MLEVAETSRLKLASLVTVPTEVPDLDTPNEDTLEIANPLISTFVIAR
jgi:hypothetical protein